MGGVWSFESPSISSKFQERNVELPSLDCASILVVVEGGAECDDAATVTRGDIFYIPAGHVARLRTSDLLAYRTFSYEEGPDHGSRIIPSAQSERHHPNTGVNQQQGGKENGEDGWSTAMVDINENKLPTAPRSCVGSRMEEGPGEKLKSLLRSKLGGMVGQEPVIFDVESEMDGFL